MHIVRSISLSVLLGTFFISLGACNHSRVDSKPAATRPALGSVDYHSRIHLANYDKHITISPDGCIGREGGEAIGEVGAATGHLTTAQMAKLVEMFRGWDKLSDSYPHFPDGPEYEITYGGKTVKFDQPDVPQLWEIRDELDRLSKALKPTQ